MFPASFEYHRASSVEEALDLLARYGADAKLLAGGQSLIPDMRYRLTQPGVLVDINKIANLGYLSENGQLSMGALTRSSDVEFSELINKKYHLLADVSRTVADPLVRRRGTVAGSLAYNDPSGDWGSAALAARAEIVIQGPRGTRTERIDDFLTGHYQTSLQMDEMLTEVRFPTLDTRTVGAYEKVKRKVGDWATASAAVQVTLNENTTIKEVGISLAAVAPEPRRASEAEEVLRDYYLTKESIQAASEAAMKVAEPKSDTRGSAEYKKDMVRVLVSRGLYRTAVRLGVEVR